MRLPSKLRKSRAQSTPGQDLPLNFEFELPDTMLDAHAVIYFRGDIIGGDKLILRVREVRVMPMDPQAGPSQSMTASLGFEPLMVFDVDTVYLGRKNAGAAD